MVRGKCSVVFEENLDETIDDWSAKGPYKFYFSEAYDAEKKEFTFPPNAAKKIGATGKVSS